MKTVIIHNCTVELKIPDILEMTGFDCGPKHPTVKLMASEYIHDVVVRDLSQKDKTIVIKKLFLKQIIAAMLPVVIGDNAVLFETLDNIQPDNIVVGD